MVHGNLCSENILVDQSKRCVLTDHYLSYALSTAAGEVYRGHRCYMAPGGRPVVCVCVGGGDDGGE